MASHCCTILYPEMRIRNLIAFAQQMSWTQILMMVSTLRPGLQWLREFGNKVSKIIYIIYTRETWLFSLATFSLVKYFHCTGGGKITTRHKKTTQNHETK